MAKSLPFLFAALFVLNAASACAQTALVGGVQNLCLPGSTISPVYALDKSWKAIVGGDLDTNAPSSVVLSRTMGKGRIIAFGCDGFLDPNQGSSYDNRRFLQNVVQWLDPTGKRAMAWDNTHRELITMGSFPACDSLLASYGYTRQNLNTPLTATSLAPFSVLFVGNATSPSSPSEINAVKTWVKNGGSLLCTGLGWWWDQYHAGMTMDDYPMVQLGRVFGVRWLRTYVDDPTNYDPNTGSTVFHTFYPHTFDENAANCASLLDATMTDYGDRLPGALERNAALRAKVIRAHMALKIPSFELAVGDPLRQTVFDSLISMLQASYGGAFRRDFAFDKTAYPTSVWIRERFWRTIRDTPGDLNSAQVDAIIAHGGLSEARAKLLQDHGMVILDDNFMGERELTRVDAVLSGAPGAFSPKPYSFTDTQAMSVVDALGTKPAVIDLGGPRGSVNVFGIKIGDCVENGFPSETPPVPADVFTLVAAHEANHRVDHDVVLLDTAWSARRAALLADAGNDHLNYLRSVIEDGFFTQNPQEFFASMANMYFASTASTFEVGRQRLLAGRRQPMEQFLFFADVYANRGNTGQGFVFDEGQSFVDYPLNLSRDSAGRIKNLWLPSGKWQIVYGQDGHVLSVTRVDEGVVGISLNPNAVLGGTKTTGTLTLSGPAPSGGMRIQLASSDPSVATTPGSVLVGDGQTQATFSVKSLPTGADVHVKIRAILHGETDGADLLVRAPRLASLTMPNFVTGGSSAFGTVSIDGPAPGGGLSVALASTNPSVLTVPPAVTIPAGSKTGTFTMTAAAVSSNTQVTISATAGATFSHMITVTRS